MEITLRHETKQAMGQQMQLSMQLLQMSVQELDAYLRELSLENPLLEELPPQQSFRGAVRERPRHTADTEDAREEVIPDEKRGTLREYLREQVLSLRVPELMRRELLYLVNETDERGYLPDDCAELDVFAGEAERCERAVKVFQSLDPPGVGARSLSECLTIQLRRLGCEGSAAYKICEGWLDALARGQTRRIAESLEIPVKEVLAAKELIGTLSPRPSNGFAERDATGYVLPDVEVTSSENGFELTTAERYLPSWRIDAFYAAMAERPGLSDEEREYFTEKLRQAAWAVRCVERRRDMLLACAGAVVEKQADFFTDGVSPLKPCTMTQLAAELGVHVSTVSRAIRGKYIACRWGVFPLAHFFQRESAEGTTSCGILDSLRALIAAEDPAKPMSDRALAEALEKSGCAVSRRTVAKYREQAGIPPAAARRR